jgi:hypothetical protein
VVEEQAGAQALNLARAAGASGTAISLLAQKLPGAQALERALAGERIGAGRIKGAVAGAASKVASGASKIASRMSEEVDAYDVVLEHLIAEGYADTNEAALVIMANMSESWINEIIQSK